MTTAPAPVTVETCTVVRCSTCGDGHNEDIGTPHFRDLDQAKRDLEGWDWTEPERPAP